LEGVFLTEIGACFYDAETITLPSSNILRVRVKVIYNGKGVNFMVERLGTKYENIDYTLDLNEVNCSERKMRILQRYAYSKDGFLIESIKFDKPDWIFITPEKADGALYNAVCK